MTSQKFNMKVIRRRCKKLMRKKFKKKIALKVVDKVWKEYVEHAIVRKMLKYGKVKIDENFSIEIVGQRIVDNPQIYSILSRGIGITKNGIIKPSANLCKERDGYFYKIVMEDKNYKGKLYFEANDKIKKRVHNELKNTNTYYRICQ